MCDKMLVTLNGFYLKTDHDLLIFGKDQVVFLNQAYLFQNVFNSYVLFTSIV